MENLFENVHTVREEEATWSGRSGCQWNPYFVVLNLISETQTFCMNFFSLPSSLHEFFFLAFSLAWIFFWFFPHPHPPHHFSNGPSLRTRQRKTGVTWHSQVSGWQFSMKNLILKVSNIFEVTCPKTDKCKQVSRADIGWEGWNERSSLH